MKAIIVTGEEYLKDSPKDRFLKVGDVVRKLLIFEFSLKEEDVYVLHGKSSSVIEAMTRIIFDNSVEDICLFYRGHGGLEGWCLDGPGNDILEYSVLGELFVYHSGMLIFVNDCCHAGVVEDALQDRWGGYMLVSASPKDRYAFGEICTHALGAWRNGEAYMPKAFVASDPNPEHVWVVDNFKSTDPNIKGRDGIFVSLRSGEDLDFLMIDRARACGEIRCER